MATIKQPDVQAAFPNLAPVEKVYEDEINMKKAAELVGVGDMRFRALVKDGKIPSSKKNSQGYWKFSRAAIEEFAASRKSRASKGGGAADGRKTFKVRLNAQEYELLGKAVAGSEISLVPANLKSDEQRARERQRRLERRQKAKQAQEA